MKKTIFISIISLFIIIFISNVAGCKKEILTETTAETTLAETAIPETTVEETTAETIPETTVPETSFEESFETTPYDEIKIRIGGSVIGRWAITNKYSTTNEVRILQHNEHPYAEPYIRFCIDNNIFCIINIDFFVGSWRPSNQELRDFVIYIKNEVKSWGGTKGTIRFTVDNEPDKWATFDLYMNYVRVVHDALDDEFDVGAGNFISSNKAWYESLAQLYSRGWYHVFDIHMQADFTDRDEINNNSVWFRNLIDKYSISRRSCTEANESFDVIKDYKMIRLLISKAQFLELEDICIAYFDYIPNDEEPEVARTFWENGVPRDVQVCDNFIDLIASLKPTD